ncbi:dephospho-CoA kinase [soil metagenome]
MVTHPKPVFGIIGSIGAGKSAVARILAEQGGTVIDADRVGHEVLELAAVKAKLSARWNDILDSDGRVNRRAVAKIVFNDAREKTFLESVVYPEIKASCQQRIELAQSDTAAKFIVLDAAVMLEAGWDGIVDKLIFVDAPLALRQQRVQARNGWTPGDLAAREASQWPAEVKRQKADAVITNAGTMAELESAVMDLFTRWQMA